MRRGHQEGHTVGFRSSRIAALPVWPVGEQQRLVQGVQKGRDRRVNEAVQPDFQNIGNCFGLPGRLHCQGSGGGGDGNADFRGFNLGVASRGHGGQFMELKFQYLKKITLFHATADVNR